MHHERQRLSWCPSVAALQLVELHLSQASRRGESFHRVPLCPLTPGSNDGVGEVWSRPVSEDQLLPTACGE